VRSKAQGQMVEKDGLAILKNCKENLPVSFMEGTPSVAPKKGLQIGSPWREIRYLGKKHRVRRPPWTRGFLEKEKRTGCFSPSLKRSLRERAWRGNISHALKECLGRERITIGACLWGRCRVPIWDIFTIKGHISCRLVAAE